jgi:hypothetical protein
MAARVIARPSQLREETPKKGSNTKLNSYCSAEFILRLRIVQVKNRQNSGDFLDIPMPKKQPSPYVHCDKSLKFGKFV